MQSEAFDTARVGLVCCLLLYAPSAGAQTGQRWSDPPAGADLNQPESAINPQEHVPVAAPGVQLSPRVQAALDLAHAYLSLWSEPNGVTVASASTFYAPVVTFHGRTRSLASILAEKRRFAERWPNRNYQHRPETAQVTCEDDRPVCTVRASFDFFASRPGKGQQTSGLGEHELLVSFEGERPVIVAENSRIIRRGHGNMTPLETGEFEPISTPLQTSTAVRGARPKDGSLGSPGDDRASTGALGPPWRAKGTVAVCSDYLAAQAQRLGSQQVSVSSAGPEVVEPDGAVAQPVYARIEYALGGKKQVREARITCRVDPGGRVVGLQE